MKTLVRWASAMLLAWGAANANAVTISVRADAWFPYNGKPGAPREGYMIDLARAIAARNGHVIDYKQLTWEEALEQTRKGQIDCVVGASREDAADFAFPTREWGRSGDTFFTLAEDAEPRITLDNLPTRRLAVIDGYAYADELQHYVEAAPLDKLVTVSGSRDPLTLALMMLVTHRVDVVAEDRAVGLERINALGMSSRIVVAGHTTDEDPIYIACTPARPEGAAYAKMFDEGLRVLRASGELARVLGRYGLEDWAAPAR